MINRRELILVLLYYVVICSASNDEDTTANPPVLKRNKRRYFSSTASSGSLSLHSDGDADLFDFDPYMGVQRERRTESFSYLISGSMSMMPYDYIEFPTPAPRIEDPWPCVEALTTLPPTMMNSEATSSLITSYMPTAAMLSTSPPTYMPTATMLSTSPPTFTQTSLNSAATTSSFTPPPTYINSLEDTYILGRRDLITSYMPTTISSSTPSPPTCTPTPISTTVTSSSPPTRLKKTGKECIGGGECKSGCCNFNCHLDSNRQQKYCIKLGPSNEKCLPFLCK